MTSAMLVDDEPNLSKHLARKLADLWPELDIVGTAINGRQALALAEDTQPDIVFLDIHMPGLTGLEVAEALPSETKIVFVTAFNEFAVEAFEKAAVDYLLKPVSDERLQRTIERLRASGTKDRSELVALLKDLKGDNAAHLKWLKAGIDDTTQLVAVEEVIYFQADNKYTTVRTKTGEHLVRKTIKDLEQALDPDKFWRIHRSTIVQVAQIASAKRDLRGRYTLRLKDCNETLLASQSYGHLFKHN